VVTSSDEVFEKRFYAALAAESRTRRELKAKHRQTAGRPR